MKPMFDNPYASAYQEGNPDGDITIMFTRPRKKGGVKNSSAVIPGALLKKVITILQRIDRDLSEL